MAQAIPSVRAHHALGIFWTFVFFFLEKLQIPQGGAGHWLTKKMTFPLNSLKDTLIVFPPCAN